MIADAIFSGAVAGFTLLLVAIEWRRQKACFELLGAVAIQSGTYKFLIVNSGWHDSAIEEVQLVRHGRSGNDTTLEPVWVRRTSRHPEEVRGLGLMVRSGERLWFTVKGWNPGADDVLDAGTTIKVKAVLERRWKCYQVRGTSGPGHGPERGDIPRDAEEVQPRVS